MELKKYTLGELMDVKRGASLAGEYYATFGDYIRRYNVFNYSYIQL